MVVSPASRSRTVYLIADGDRAYAKALAHALRRAQVPPKDILTLTDGNKVLRYLCRDAVPPDRNMPPPPSVLLLDAWLPKRLGLEVLVWARATPLYRTLPIIFMCVGEDQGLATQAYQRGANSFIVKPYGTESMDRAMRTFAQYWGGMNIAASPESLGSAGNPVS